jgi:hypothetical protein
MKILQQIVTVVVVVIATSAGAQSPAPDSAQTPAPATSSDVTSLEATPSPSSTVPVEPPSLIPPNILPGPGRAALPQIPAGPDLKLLSDLFKQTTLGKVADEYRLHLQMAALETHIRNETDLHEARAWADKAHTDLERRHRFKAYYQLYFKKLIALASTPELQAYLRAHQAAQESSLLQPRVRHDPDEKDAAALAQVAGGATAATALPTPVQARANGALRTH